MDTFLGLLILVSLLGLVYFSIAAIIKFVKKDSATGKKMIKGIGGSIALFLLSAIILGATSEPDTATKKKENDKKTTVSSDVKKETKEEAAEKAQKAKEEKAAAEKKAKEEAEAKRKAEAEARKKAALEKKKTLAALRLSGTGDSATKKFKLNDGFVIIHAKHTGGSNFAVQLLDSNANPVELVVNEIGNYDGSQIYNVQSGNYLFDIKADGNWSIQMSQYIPKKIYKGSASGKGDSAIFMKLNAGANTFAFTHNGQSNFVVQANGTNLLVNEIGNYKGSTIQKIEDTGIYYFNISADGNWTMKVE